MENIFEALAAQLDRGQGAVLCTIAASRGSTPRGAGARMLVTAAGDTAGTVGGGAVERRSVALARSMLAEKRSGFETYRLSAGDIAGTGMICGGDVEIFFQYFDPADDEARGALERVLELLDQPGASWLVTAAEGSRWRMGTYDRKNGPRGLDLPPDILERLPAGGDILERRGDQVLFVQPLARAGTAYLLGAGHVSRALARILAMTEFRTVVYDQRPDAVTRECFPEAAERVCGPFGEALARLPSITAEDYVVIMTPGHQGDYAVLSQALRTPARYIGCIGSRKKVAATRERLLADGFTAPELDRIWSPIGLPIGGETPAEVAVSVAAQLIACRSGRLGRGETFLK